MVVIKNALWLFLTLGFLSSCAKLPPKNDETARLYQEALDLLRGYEWVYFEKPQSVDDLLHVIELEGGLLSSGDIDRQSYDFLKRHRKRIVIAQLPLRDILSPEELEEWKSRFGEDALEESYTCMFFRDRKLKNLIASVSPHEGPCHLERAFGERRFFDANGDPIVKKDACENYDKDLRTRLFSSQVRYKYPDEKWRREQGSPFEDFLIVEYTRENGLRNICNGQRVEMVDSAYFTAFSDCLNGFLRDNPQISRIVLDTYIPAEF